MVLVTKVGGTLVQVGQDLSENGIKKVLMDFGLTEKETEIYIFLARHGALRGGEVSKRTKTHRGLIYRILGSLQSKGLVETTLESPARFTAVQFEKFIDLSIKAKQEEAAQLESTKSELLNYWKKLSTSEAEPTPEKFVVIEGKQKIFLKISQMIKETNSQFSATITVSALARADQYGLFESVIDHPLKSRIQFRFLTELNEQNLNATKTLLKKIPKIPLQIKSRNSEIGLRLSPRIVIRDEAEILFFITPRRGTSDIEQDEVCLWTNCRELVQTFKTVFEEAWQDALEIKKMILSMETGGQALRTSIAHELKDAMKNYDDVISSAKEEITILTSCDGLLTYLEKTFLAKKVTEDGVTIKIMSPITNQNLKAAEKLSKFCEVRHVPPSFLKTTIVDGKYLFQFGKLRDYRWTPKVPEKSEGLPSFEEIAYSDNSTYVAKMKALLDDIWKNSTAPSKVTIDSILGLKSAVFQSPEPSAERSIEMPQSGFPTYCSAQAVIHTLGHFDMPDMLIDVMHFGEPTDEKANWMSISMWLKTPKGYAFVPTAIVVSRGRKDTIATKIEKSNKAIFAGTPAGQNVLRVKEHELRVWRQNNTLFAGWTVPIPVFPPKYVVPPSILLFEGYGNSTHSKRTLSGLPSGYKVTIENDGFDAFVTFISPASRYTGPGTEGRLYASGISTVTRPT